jgi:hypothetical protein
MQASSNGQRTVSFRLCFNACFGQSVDIAGREAVDQSGILARVTGHRDEVRVEVEVKICVCWMESTLSPWMKLEGF